MFRSSLASSQASGFFFCSETPRFLQSSGRADKALQVLVRLRAGDTARAKAELAMVQREIDEEREAGSATWAEVFRNPVFRNVIILGCCVQILQIMTGINAIVSFGGTLFTKLGVTGLASSITPSCFFLLGNTVGSFVLVDRLGRRSLLICGMLAMMAAMLVGGLVTLLCASVDAEGKMHISKDAGRAIIAAMNFYLFSFGISWGFGAWLYISEIMPLRVRGKAVGLCTGANWGPANVTSAFITPMMIAGTLGPGGTLLFFGCVCALAVPFAVFCLPETKGKSLEEVVPMFRFASCSDFRTFVRGNVRGGMGMGAGLPIEPKAGDNESSSNSSRIVQRQTFC